MARGGLFDPEVQIRNRDPRRPMEADAALAGERGVSSRATDVRLRQHQLEERTT